MHMVAGDLSGEAVVTASAFDSGSTTMDFAVSNVVAEGSGYAVLLSNSGTASKIFNNSDSERNVTVDIVVEEVEDDLVPMTFLGTVEIQFVDLNGHPHDGVNIVSYVVTADSDTTSWSNQETLTPLLDQMAVLANTQEQINNGETVTMEFTLESIIVEVLGELTLLNPVVGTKVFHTFDSDHTIVLEVPVIDL
ncbi:MAG: hypothetical protein ACJAZF_002164 [Granulosicoccus sp.]|jgi:hypothetical protein